MAKALGIPIFPVKSLGELNTVQFGYCAAQVTWDEYESQLEAGAIYDEKFKKKLIEFREHGIRNKRG